MTGIQDVARAVGVSTATVSRALRGLPGVTAETREAVMEAAHRLGYTPSPSAVRLASGRTRTVAVIVPYMTRWFFSTVAQGVESALREQHYDMLLYNLAGSTSARGHVFETDLLTKRVDAVLIVGLRPSDAELARLERLGRPMAFVGVEVPGAANVCIDDAQAARLATRHLIDLGHENIAHVGGPGSLVLDGATPRRRQESFHATMAEAGHPVDPILDLDGGFTIDGGIAAGRALLARTPSPTAVFAASDEMAMGVIRAASDLGLRVPEDLSVIGIDNHELASFFDLTTVAQDTVAQGRRAAEVLVSDLEARSRGEVPRLEKVVLPTRLMLRRTTSAPSR